MVWEKAVSLAWNLKIGRKKKKIKQLVCFFPLGFFSPVSSWLIPTRQLGFTNHTTAKPNPNPNPITCSLWCT